MATIRPTHSACILVLAFAFGATSCQKEVLEGNARSQFQPTEYSPNTQKGVSFFLGFSTGTAVPKLFQVWKDGVCYGHVWPHPSSIEPHAHALEYTGNKFRVFSGECPLGTSFCEFDKGFNSSSFGPWYTVIPMNTNGFPWIGRKMLKFRVKGVPMPGLTGGTHRYFKYEVATGNWSIGSQAATMIANGTIEYTTITIDNTVRVCATPF